MATRVSLALLSKLFDWRASLIVVRPETLLPWHRAGFRLLCRLKSRPGRPAIPLELRQLIRRMAELPTRAVEIAGITTNPTEAWMLQLARNAADAADGILVGKSPLIVDRDAKYSPGWRAFVEEQGVEVIRLPPRTPNLNAYVERFVRSIKDECLNRMIFIGEASLRRAVCDFMLHYHGERNHRGLGNRLIRAEPRFHRSAQ